MGKDTAIEWASATFNPWWGCTKVSPGCANCYAEKFAHRYGHNIWGDGSERRFFGDKHWSQPLKWNAAAEKAGERRRVFCASMADVFEDRDELMPHRERLFRMIRDTPHLDWLLLTKRPENVDRMWTAEFRLPNIWMGTTAEDQEHWDKRVPELLAIHARVLFVSAEPLLGPIVMDDWPIRPEWIIAGGESGPRSRPIEGNWVRDLRDQCAGTQTAFFFKQWGGVRKKDTGRELDGRTWDEVPDISVNQTEKEIHDDR